MFSLHEVHGFQNVTYTVNEGEILNTVFGLNVKGTTRFPRLALTGMVTAAPHTASKFSFVKMSVHTCVPICICLIGSSDFEEFSPILTRGNSEISLITVDDGITLEYNDTVILTYTPTSLNLTELIIVAGEFIRDTATVIITDNDSGLSCNAVACSCSVSQFFCRIGDIF